MPQTPALRSLRPIIVVLAWLSGSATAEAEAPTLPQYGGDSHLGVVTCAGSTCHGATRPFQNAAINQNEFVIWQRKDKHARAYKVLLNDQSKRIARNLGLKAAHEAKICLDCHSDNVAEDLRGKRFQLSDGVGCESCHGGSKRYLGPHVSGENTRQQNLDAGMYATETPESRALLCLSCHLGTDDNSPRTASWVPGIRASASSSTPSPSCSPRTTRSTRTIASVSRYSPAFRYGRSVS